MRRVLPFILLVQLAFVLGCKPRLEVPTPPAVQLVTTSISTPDCRRDIDAQDPNSLPYLVCAGAAGTTVRVRSVEAGKVSVDMVLPNQRVAPLSLQQHVSRHMYGLESPLLWRLEQRDGRWQALALVMQVAERADSDDPALVTRRIDALARVDADGACIVAVRPATHPAVGGDAAWMADAKAQPCAKALPE